MHVSSALTRGDPGRRAPADGGVGDPLAPRRACVFVLPPAMVEEPILWKLFFVGSDLYRLPDDIDNRFPKRLHFFQIQRTSQALGSDLAPLENFVSDPVADSGELLAAMLEPVSKCRVPSLITVGPV